MESFTRVTRDTENNYNVQLMLRSFPFILNTQAHEKSSEIPRSPLCLDDSVFSS